MKKFPWRGTIALAITVGLLWWAFKNVSWAELWHHLREADPLLMALAVIGSFLVFPLRAARWRPILHPVAPNLPFGPLWRATCIGFMANSVLPSRAGEIIRPFMLARETHISFSAALASLVVDRIFDAIVVLVLILVALLDPSLPSGLSLEASITATIVIVGVAMIALYAMVFFPDVLVRLFEAFARRVAPKYEHRGADMLRSFASGLNVLRDPKLFFIVFFWALAMWLVQPVAFWIGFKAFGIDVPFTAALLVQGIIVFAVAIPSTPGFFGLFEAAAKAGLAIYGVPESLALAWGLSFHVLSLIPIVVVGLYYLARSGVKLSDLKQIKA